MTSPSPSPQHPSPYLTAVIGVACLSCTIASTRYAKDADKAPAMEQRVELLRMSAERVEAFESLAATGRDAGVDAYAAAQGFVGMFDDVDSRLRPLDWQERLVKTYLTFGMLVDFSMALADGLPQPVRLRVLDALSVDRFGGFAARELEADIAADPQLAARLGLWGRRVVGEEIGTLQRVIAREPDLVAGGADAASLRTVLSQGATSRMRGLSLRM
ncbi:MAG: ferritin-like fold-containing protein [Actinomyces sp.]|uniref:ferritin-like fold-containing protein n=1 Tax=Actinomyces sp. TaxID=29317 RepID=UPI0026DC302D|nr:ferritin-like fold-containing protein [Actinomyces sp.]MDO4242356.1 ferritin-like fold-containing protein [Actinomyces sp.]